SGLDRGATKVGERFEERIHPDDLEAHKEAIRVALERGEKFENEFRYIRPDGEVRWLAGRGQFMKSEVGGSTRMVGLNWDITERKQFEDSLEEARRLAEAANRSKSEFVANMSHEIRTPMTAVLGYADLLAADETDKERKQYLRVIKRNGDFLLRLINDILDLSKIESGKLDVSTEAFIIQEVVEDVRAMMADRALGKQLDFQVEYELGVPEAVASDAKRLKQILVNLIGNAIKFTDVGGVKVVVRFIEGLPGQLQFDVIDTGIGVPEAHQERMFEPFSQGDASVSRRFGGTGLGLAISQRLARVLGGEITVSSEPGRGSTFRCTISAEVVSTDDSRLTSRQTPTRVTQQSELARHDGLRILVVDDRRDVRHLARHMLERSGATVTLACDGVEALAAVEAARQHDDVPFELILLDMQMPGLDGYETAQRLRSMGFEHPIIAFTADAMQGDMGRCLESGCDDYLSKPIDVGELFTLVTTYSQQLDLDRLIARRAQRRASDSRDQSMD
ncbi:MAG: response regulator, partial [Planctomycetes bacterium]|nr:response regulator [Planctomycetota bacterium]